MTGDEIRDILPRVADRVMTERSEIIDTCRPAILPPLSDEDPEKEKTEPEAEINVTAERIDDAMKDNAHTAPDQADYRARCDTPAERSGKAKKIA